MPKTFLEEPPTKSHIDEIFNKWAQCLKLAEEYTPEPVIEQVEVPPYTPTPKTAGPKPLTLEEYRRRQEACKRTLRETQERQTLHREAKHKSRSGFKVKARQKLAELYRVINITTNIKLKKKLLQHVKAEKKAIFEYNRNKKYIQ